MPVVENHCVHARVKGLSEAHTSIVVKFSHLVTQLVYTDSYLVMVPPIRENTKRECPN
jgi:hypothetical protein